MGCEMRAAIKDKFFCWAYPPVTVPLVLWCLYSHAYYALACVACSILFWIVQLILSALLRKPEARQKERCAFIGFLLAVPALGTIAVGALFLLRRPSGGPALMACAAAALFVCLLLQMISLRGDGSPAGRFLRLALGAAMSSPLSLTMLVLYGAETEDTAALSGVLIGLFGVGALLVAENLVLVAFCGYRSTRESVRLAADLFRRKKLVFTRLSIMKDGFLVAGKAALSLLSMSFFMCASALYSAGMGVARFVAVRMHAQDRGRQLKSYRRVGGVISASSLCYVVYAARLFSGGKTAPYPMQIGLLIALYTFVEFGINLRDALQLRKSRALEAKALRAIGLASTLLCFVLTQTAIMSFASEGDNSVANALAGVVFGGLAALVGLYVIADSFRQKKIHAF